MSTATTVAGMLAQQSKAFNVLVDVEAFERLKTWTATAGQTITYEGVFVQDTKNYPFRTVHAVHVTDRRVLTATKVALTSRASVALVDANPGSYYQDPAVAKVYVSMPDSSSPGHYIVKASFWQYFCTGDTLTGAPVLDATGNTYYPNVLAVPSQKKEFSDLFFGTMTTGSGDIILVNASGGLDSPFGKWLWDTGRVVIKLGGEAITVANSHEVFGGKTNSHEMSEATLVLHCRDKNESLDAPMSTLWTEDDWRRSIEWTPFSRIASQFANEIGMFTASMSQFGGAVPSALFKSLIGRAKPIAYGPVTNGTPVQIAAFTFKRHSTSNTMAVYALEGRRIKAINTITVGGHSMAYDASGSGGYFAAWYNLEYGLLWLESDTAGGTTVDLTSDEVLVTFEGRSDDGESMIIDFPDIVGDLISNVVADATFNSAAADLSRLHCESLLPVVYENTDLTLRTVLNKICASCLGQLWNGDDGDFRFSVFAPTLVGEVEISDARGETQPLKFETDSSRLFASSAVGWRQDQSLAVQFVREERAEAVCLHDAEKPFEVSDTYLGDEESANVMAIRYARLGAQTSLVASSTLLPSMLTKDLLATFWMEATRLPGLDVGTRHHFYLSAFERDFDSFTVAGSLRDRRLNGSQGYLNADDTLDWGSATSEEKNTIGFLSNTFGYPDDSDTASYRTCEYW